MSDRLPTRVTRRDFLVRSGALSAAFLSLGPSAILAKETDEEVSPAEDLMREHGALNRILLIYDAARERLERGQDFPPESLKDAAGIVRRFIEGYHEKLEEDHLFPRFEKAGKLVDLVKVLREQHEAGRRVTASILDLAGAGSSKRKELAENLRLFVRMYRPHEAREDTVLFPAFHGIVSKSEYEDLGEKFEDKERELFGKDGFEGVVRQISEIEKKVGLYDLAQFTPGR